MRPTASRQYFDESGFRSGFKEDDILPVYADSIISGIHRRLLLAPASAFDLSDLFECWQTDSSAYEKRLAEMQRLRGQIYLEDGAISRESLDEEGRHRLNGDEQSWHILTVSESGDVQGCIRSFHHRPPTHFHDLAIRQSSQAKSTQWGPKLREAVEVELQYSRTNGLNFFEVGGWALAKQIRCTRAALYTALSTYALAQLLGGGVGLALATVRNRSAGILKRIGGENLRVGDCRLPPYYDHRYGCEMEALSFRTGQPTAMFARQAQAIRNLLQIIPVIYPAQPDDPNPTVAAEGLLAESMKAGGKHNTGN